MKKIYIILIFLFIAVGMSKAQPIIWSQGFESADSINLPPGWNIYNNATFPIDPLTNWTVRTVGSSLPGLATSLCVVHTGSKSIGASWNASIDTNTNSATISDVWLVAPRLMNVASDAYLSFWLTGGSSTFSDSVSVWITNGDGTPTSFTASPSNRFQNYFFAVGSVYGAYEQYFIDLADYAGQNIYVGFRYNMDCAINGYFVQLDDVDYAGTVGISQNGTSIPDKFALNQNYPNPFNPTTKINFDLAKATNVKLTVFNSLGQMVMNIFDGYQPAGSYQAEFNGNSLSSGTYYYRLETESFVETKKMQLIK